MTYVYPANTAPVAEKWLSSLPGFNSGMVATRVPEKAEQSQSLIDSGFVTFRTVGGTPDMYVPERQPVLDIRTYGFPTTSASRKPQWALANSLAERILKACQDTSSFNAKLTLPAGYPPARVQQAHALSEPMEVYGDRSYWAVYRFDLQIYWVELPS